MAAPRLNRKLALEAPQDSPDGSGGVVRNWTVVGDLWAEVRSGAGGERAGEAVALSRQIHRITIRAAPAGSPRRPAPGQRFREGARIFQIHAVAERDAEGRYLTCLAEEEVAT